MNSFQFSAFNFSDRIPARIVVSAGMDWTWTRWRHYIVYGVLLGTDKSLRAINAQREQWIRIGGAGGGLEYSTATTIII